MDVRCHSSIKTQAVVVIFRTAACIFCYLQFHIVQHQCQRDFQSLAEAFQVNPFLPGMGKRTAYGSDGVRQDSHRQRNVAVRRIGFEIYLAFVPRSNHISRMCGELFQLLFVDRSISRAHAQQFHFDFAALAAHGIDFRLNFLFHLFQAFL